MSNAQVCRGEKVVCKCMRDEKGWRAKCMREKKGVKMQAMVTHLRPGTNMMK